MYHKEVGPLPGGFVHLSAADPYRIPNCTEFCVKELEREIGKLGAENIAAMIAEPSQPSGVCWFRQMTIGLECTKC